MLVHNVFNQFICFTFKGVNLTLAWNDPNYAKTDNLLEGLIKLDPLRVNYYNDLS